MKINKVYGDEALNGALAWYSLCRIWNRIYGIGILLKCCYATMVKVDPILRKDFYRRW
ncbi:hypothetical protein HMPREF1569_2676 [Klebsiella oxytoca OK-1]|nr:hypothetical protein HMPREF1569_2676 [Klebsiella oxytoca OK-1]